MAKKRAQKSELTGGKILHYLYDTEIYQQMAQVNVPQGELTNHSLLKELLNRQEVINTIMLFLQGQVELGKAIDDFREKISPKTKRFDHIQRLTEKLFYTLANTIKTILKLKGEVADNVQDVLEEDPLTINSIELEVGESKDLKKGEPVPIKGAEQLQVEINRGEDKTKHLINIAVYKDGLLIWCSTSDSEDGKKTTMNTKKGDEHVIGRPNNFLLRKAQANLEREKALYKKADRAYQSHYLRCTVSEETRSSKAKADQQKTKITIAEAKLKKLANNPLQLWFDEEKSADISQDHIIVELTEDNVVVITDDGEECTTILTRVK